jgi:hypothetical protein
MLSALKRRFKRDKADQEDCEADNQRVSEHNLSPRG